MKLNTTPFFVLLILSVTACTLPTEFPLPEVDRVYEDGVIDNVQVVDDIDEQGEDEQQGVGEQVDASEQADERIVEGLDAKSDITAPPSMGENTASPQDSTNPDETVSFRKWREEQAAEK